MENDELKLLDLYTDLQHDITSTHSASTHRQRFAVVPYIFSSRAALVPEESPAGEVFRLRAPDHPESEGRKEMENVA